MEDLEAGFVQPHWNLARHVHMVDGNPWVKSNKPSKEQLLEWRNGDRWELPVMSNGDLCMARIPEALAGEDEGEFLVDWIEDQKVAGKNADGTDAYEYLVHWAGYEDKTREPQEKLSPLRIEDYNPTKGASWNR